MTSLNGPIFYIDDINVIFKNEDKFKNHLGLLFHKLLEFDVKMKPLKYIFRTNIFTE